MRNEAFYKKIELRDADKFTSVINKSNWWKLVLMLVLFVIIVPFFPKRYGRNYPTTDEEYVRQVVIASGIVTILSTIGLWVLIVKPYMNSKRGYNLRGQFKIIKKIELFGQRKIKLQPGTNHSVNVDKQLYKFLNIGDSVLIERRALGDLIKVKKI